MDLDEVSDLVGLSKEEINRLNQVIIDRKYTQSNIAQIQALALDKAVLIDHLKEGAIEEKHPVISKTLTKLKLFESGFQDIFNFKED